MSADDIEDDGIAGGDGECTEYPDLEPDGLGQIKSIKRINGMKAVPPNISWGEDYKGWPIERRLRFAERLASTMNHAADVLQQERQSLIDLATRQEGMIVALQVQAEGHSMVMHGELQKEGVEKQELYTRIVELTAEVKRLKRELKAAQAG